MESFRESAAKAAHYRTLERIPNRGSLPFRRWPACATLPPLQRPSTCPLDNLAPYFTSLLAAALYIAASANIWRHLAKREHAPGTLLTTLLLAAIVCHAIGLWHGIHSAEGTRLSIGNATSLMLLVMSAFLTAATLFLPVASLLVLVAPITAATLIIVLVSGPTEAAAAHFEPLLLGHITTSISAVSVLMLAFIQALLLRQVESDLKHHTLQWARLMPPLETMERLLFAAVWVGLGLLLLAIGSGFVALDDLFSQRGMVHHTVLLSAAALAYIALLIGRYRLGWRGTTAVRWVIGATILLVLGYFGSKFVLEVLLQE